MTSSAKTGDARELAQEIRDSCAVGDHNHLSQQPLRAMFGFAGIIVAALRRAPDAVAVPPADVLHVVANPVAHGAALVRAVRSGVRSTVASVADLRLAEDGSLEVDFPSFGARSLARIVTPGRVRAARALRRELPRGTRLVGARSRLYREYLFLAQAMRYLAVEDALRGVPSSTVVVADFDRSAYARPWIWGARRAGLATATLMHGSPNLTHYVPVLADAALVWGDVQASWIAAHSPGARPIVVGRADLDIAPLPPAGERPRLVVCHSREVLSADEVSGLLSLIGDFAGRGYTTTLRLHPTMTPSTPTGTWQAVVESVDETAATRGAFVAGLRDQDVVACVTSSSAVEALAAGVAAVVVADGSRVLPSDLEAVRSATGSTLSALRSSSGPDRTAAVAALARAVIASTGAEAGRALDAAIDEVRRAGRPADRDDR